tara:strand:+ start:2195 stop:2524 length:330 start_codon:yes stop_codon:yes gene_type:complete
VERVKKKSYIQPFDDELYDFIDGVGGIMAQIMLGQLPTEPHRNKMKHHHNFQKNADELIFLCPKCNTCWEYVYEGWRHQPVNNEKRVKVNHYDDFPRMGKTEKICTRCI